jgi:hypothetical protein
MLAHRLTTILPAMTLVEAIEITRIDGIARAARVTTRPCQASRHTIPDMGLIGGSLVKSVSRLSWQQALLSRASASSCRGHFSQTDAHTREMLLVDPGVLYRDAGLHTRVTSWRADVKR